MNKQKFNQVVKDRSRIGEKELIQLVELGNDYPYSQVIHTLIAKGSRNKSLPNYNSKLHKAAFYVTDRGVLKKVIDDTLPEYIESSSTPVKNSGKTTSKAATKEKASQTKKAVPAKTPVSKAPAKTPGLTKPISVAPAKATKPKETPATSPEVEKKKNIVSTEIKSTEDSGKVNFKEPEKSISEIVLESLAEMKKAKALANLEEVVPETPETKPLTKEPLKTSTKASSKTAATKNKPTATKKATTTKKTTATTKSSSAKKAVTRTAAKPRTSAAAKASSTASKTKPSTRTAKSSKTKKTAPKSSVSEKKTSAAEKATSKSPKSATSKKKIEKSLKVSGSDLIGNIKKSRKKQKDIGSKQQEQIEIINSFIKKGGSLKPAKSEDEISLPSVDLSKKSTEFHENLISENLAKIFVRQKQYPKAIDIYKKLIWKFPQKKSYFAAQIEEIKKL